MARKPYEGSKEDIREDARGAKAAGLTAAQYERTSRDKREDQAGKERLKRLKTQGRGKRR